jgi:phospholipase C
MENKPYDSVIGSPSAPFETALAAACGVATNYHAVTHPSLPNYIAATSGSTQGVADNDPPSVHQLAGSNIFSQVTGAGKTWRAYAESAPGSCPLVDAAPYAVKHVPAAYYTNLRGDCASSIVPMGTTTAGSLLDDLNGPSFPSFAFVTPNLCNDTHDCPVSVGDAWLQAWFAKIVASPTYRSGRTIVFLTWDEDDDSASNRVPLIVVSPSTPPGTKVGAIYDHYSLLRTTEQLLGLTYLSRASDASSMASGFNVG